MFEFTLILPEIVAECCECGETIRRYRDENFGSDVWLTANGHYGCIDFKHYPTTSEIG